jgi:hypothetical protein
LHLADATLGRIWLDPARSAAISQTARPLDASGFCT